MRHRFSLYDAFFKDLKKKKTFKWLSIKCVHIQFGILVCDIIQDKNKNNTNPKILS